MPDALPALAVLGCACPEPVTFAGVPQARSKETDRVAVMARELGALGADVRELPDGLTVRPSTLTGGRVHSHGDHRVAMACAIAALASDGPVEIVDSDVAGVTYPNFFSDLAAVAPGSVE
jgi:3-phosphoshikimate 1-carboxyvinyltransferase